MRHALTDRLARKGVLILDGGLATTLEDAGHRLDDDLWSARLLLDDDDALRAAHHAFAEAGADVIATATYQASHAALEARGLTPEDVEAVYAKAVALARQASRGAPEPPLVAGSLGSDGACLHDGSEYRGGYGKSRAELAAFHRPRIRALADGGADLLAFETIPSLVEAEALLDALDAAPELEVWLSFSIRDETHLAEGQSLLDAARRFEGHPQLKAVGVNCCSPSLALAAVRNLVGHTRLPVVAYPNRGECYIAGQGFVAGTGEPLVEGMLALVAAGARLVGGCCRTTPADIATFAAALATGSAK